MSGLIDLCDLWNPRCDEDYKVHFAKRNTEGEEPLDAMAMDFNGAWKAWQEYRAGNNHWNRRYIFALAHDYNRPNTFLFGGIWRVITRHEDRYDVELTSELEGFIKRLRISLDYADRQTRCALETYFPRMGVSELLAERYSARAFPGLHSLTVTFAELESVVSQSVAQWVEPLSAVNGIYVLRDHNLGANYIGAAYGVDGVWGRWRQYVTTGHGGNRKTTLNFGNDPIAYARKHVQFTLLEPLFRTLSVAEVIKRERHWMAALGTRGLDQLNS